MHKYVKIIAEREECISYTYNKFKLMFHKRFTCTYSIYDFFFFLSTSADAYCIIIMGKELSRWCRSVMKNSDNNIRVRSYYIPTENQMTSINVQVMISQMFGASLFIENSNKIRLFCLLHISSKLFLLTYSSRPQKCECLGRQLPQTQAVPTQHVSP